MGGLINRVADNWRPLFAIADMIGGDWPSRAREAAANLMPKETESIGPMLLEDIKAAFEAKSTDRLSSEEICEALAAMEGRPWAEYGKAGKAISKNQLAKSLKQFRIVPDSVRIGGKTPGLLPKPVSGGVGALFVSRPAKNPFRNATPQQRR